jgi:tRNA threonylcarbamoyl adenosine modification protein YeaZ
LKILALDAGLGPFSAALDLDGNVTSDQSERNDALEAGLQRAANLLEAGRIAVAQLDCIAVGIGPGSFTGIRIALSFAKALAYAARVPLTGISSYDVLTPADVPGACLTVVSGRPGVVCARLRGAGVDRVACGSPATVFPQLLSKLASNVCLWVSANTEDVFPEIGEGSRCVHRLISPTQRNPAAVVVARLARDCEPHSSPHGVAPDYGEMPAVTLPKAGTGIAP